VIRWLINYWCAYQRRLDKEILWPICKRETESLDDARNVFMVHVSIDPAWASLGMGKAALIVREWS
jgi:hypothetical protein